MAFIEGTQVLSETGWKNIQDVGGTDRLLVRNFIGDAQFEKPFAVKKRHYSGEIISGGSKTCKFKVTPEHQIVYTDRKGRVHKTTAGEVVGKRGTYLKHRSKYSPDRYIPPQKIKKGNYTYEIDKLDWYKLCGFVLRKGQISKYHTRLILALDKQNPKKDMDLICDVLDRLKLDWNFTEPNLIVVSQKSNIASKLSRVLGSRFRKQMYIPDKMIYNASIEDGRALIDTFIRASRRDGQGVENTVQFSTTNKKLIESLEILGLLCGYTISYILAKPAGSKVPAGVTKNDSYAVYVRNSVNEVSITNKKEVDYSGKVYEIDMFNDQLLIKEEECSPIWMKPK